MMQTDLRVGDRPDSMMETGAPDGCRCVARPEKAHRIGRPLRVASGGALHYASELSPRRRAVAPQEKGVP